MDKYYQVARCFRDEDLRADRQPEFTQVDMEHVLCGPGGYARATWRSCSTRLFARGHGPRELDYPFPRLTWQEAMDRYGSDKPDLRFGLPIVDVSGHRRGRAAFSVFTERVAERRRHGPGASTVKGAGAIFTRSTIEPLTRPGRWATAPRAWPGFSSVTTGRSTPSCTKYFTPTQWQALLDAHGGASPGTSSSSARTGCATVRRTLGGLRLEVGGHAGPDRPKDDFQLLRW